MSKMIPVSEHLHGRPYQVALSRDKDLVFRKWNHVGTTWAVSHGSAAFRHASGDIVRRFCGVSGIVFEFTDGTFVQVGF